MDLESINRKVAEGLSSLALVVDQDARDRLVAFLRLLEKWNGTYNLTAVRAVDEMVALHLMDSLAVEPWLQGPRVADVGTGAGLPGLPLAIVRPDLSFVLIDSSGKKTRFVKHAIGRLGLDNVFVVHARVQDYDGDAAFDTVISRAFSALGDFVSVAGHLCSPGGAMLAMKGILPEDEMAESPEQWPVRGIHRLEVPGLEADRHLLVLRRELNVAG